MSTPLTLSSNIYHSPKLVCGYSQHTQCHYLALQLPFEPINILRQQLENQLKRPLKHRQEAHITVLSPTEYQAIQSQISINDLYTIIQPLEYAESWFEVICLGRSKAQLDNFEADTFYLVIQSLLLTQLRQQIFLAIKKKDEKENTFHPFNYYPHITVGFSHQDLHPENHFITKDKRNCFLSVNIF